MKNLFIATITAFALFLSVSTASAEPIQKDVVEVTIKDMKSGYLYAHFVFPQPLKTQLKACPGDHAHDCLYAVAGKKTKELYRFQADEMMMVLYIYESKITVASR